MTISAQSPYIRQNFTGDGAYPFTTFVIYDADDLVVTYIDTDANEYTLVEGAGNDYTVALAGAAPNTATVTILATCTYASETTGYLEIKRSSELSQEIDLQNSGPFNQDDFEEALDKIVMILQEFSYTISENISAISYKGSWATSTSYSLLDIIVDDTDGYWYVCIIAHTSGTFEDDLADGLWSFFLKPPSTHTIASHSDTDATGADLEFLTDGSASIADAQHAHAVLKSSGAGYTAITANSLGSISLKNGGYVNEFSLDGNLLGNSNEAVPTERAVKTYVDYQESVMLATNCVYKSYALLKDIKADTTVAGAATGGTTWDTRDLAEVIDDDGILSVASNVITLAAGTYRCLIQCPAFNVDEHQARLRDTDTPDTLLVGTTAYSASNQTTYSIISGEFTIASETDIEVQHIVGTPASTSDFGAPGSFGESEVYTVAEFWKKQ